MSGDVSDSHVINIHTSCRAVLEGQISCHVMCHVTGDVSCNVSSLM